MFYTANTWKTCLARIEEGGIYIKPRIKFHILIERQKIDLNNETCFIAINVIETPQLLIENGQIRYFVSTFRPVQVWGQAGLDTYLQQRRFKAKLSMLYRIRKDLYSS